MRFSEETVRKAIKNPKDFGPRRPVTLVQLVCKVHGITQVELMRRMGFQGVSAIYYWKRQTTRYPDDVEAKLVQMLRAKFPDAEPEKSAPPAPVPAAPENGTQPERSGPQDMKTLTIVATNHAALNAIRTLAEDVAQRHPGVVVLTNQTARETG